MKIPWLEKMAQSGSIRTEALGHIYKDTDGLLTKRATETYSAETMEKAVAAAKQLAAWLLLAGGVGGGKLLMDKAKASAFKDNILKNRDNIAKHEDFSNDPAKAKARFDELTRIAPSVATNSTLAHNMVKSRLNEGFSMDDMQALALIQATHAAGKDTKGMLPKLASVRPEALGQIVADVFILTKTAAPKFTESRIKSYLGTVGLMTSIPLLMGVGGGIVKDITSKIDKRKMEERLKESFQKAIKLSDPDKEPLHGNSEKAKQAFEALAHFAPHVALQPQAARAFMSKIVAYDQGMNISDIKDLSEIERNISGIKTSPFAEGFKGTAQMVGLQGATTKGFEMASGPYADARKNQIAHELQSEMGFTE